MFAVKVGVDVTVHDPLVSRVPSTGVGLSYTVLFCTAFHTFPRNGAGGAGGWGLGLGAGALGAGAGDGARAGAGAGAGLRLGQGVL